METFSNFLVEYIYAVPAFIFVACLIFIISLFLILDKMDKLGKTYTLCTIFGGLAVVLLVFSLIWILTVSTFYFRVESNEFGIKKSCWKDGITKACIFSDPGLHGTAEQVIFFSSIPIEIINENCKTSFGFRANSENFCNFYDSKYVISPLGFDLKYSHILSSDNTQGEVNSGKVIKEMLELRSKYPNFILPAFIKEVKTETKK